MSRFLLVVSLIILTVAVCILFDSRTKKHTIISDFKIEFSNDLASSNLYPPANLKADEINSQSIKISWNFEDMHLVTEENMAPEYAIHSGYRIYRNSQFYKDLPGLNNSFLDTDLYPGKRYVYEISALTFDNKIEGQKSSKLDVNTNGAPIYIERSLKIDNVLIEGDSITRGQKANPGNGWADQVALWLKGKGSKNIVNFAKDNTFSYDLSQRIAGEVELFGPDTVFIGVGMNDLYAASYGIGGVSLWQYLENYRNIISRIGQNSSVVIIGVTPARDLNDKVSVWNSALQDFAYNTKSVFIPTDYLSGKDLVDAIHPDQNAHDKIAQKTITVLYTYLK